VGAKSPPFNVFTSSRLALFSFFLDALDNFSVPFFSKAVPVLKAWVTSLPFSLRTSLGMPVLPHLTFSGRTSCRLSWRETIRRRPSGVFGLFFAAFPSLSRLTSIFSAFRSFPVNCPSFRPLQTLISLRSHPFSGWWFPLLSPPLLPCKQRRSAE